MLRHFPVLAFGLVLAATVHAAGSAEETVYRTYEAAMQKGDLDALTATMTQARADEFQSHRKDASFPMMFGFIRGNALHDTKVDKVAEEGDAATLNISGKDSAGNAATSVVRMKREDGQWRIEKESTSTHG